MADKDQINQKIQSVGEDSSKRLGGNEELNRSIQEVAEKIIRNNDIKSEPDSLKDIENTIAKRLGVEVNDKIRVEAKRIKKEVEKWSLKNIETVRDYRKESVKKEIIEGYKNANPNISNEELKLAEGMANLVADTYHGGPGMENIQSELLAKPIENVVDLKGVYSNIEGVVNVAKKTPKQLKELSNNFEKFKDGLSTLKQPGGIREFSSFQNIMATFGSGNTMERFTGLGQSRVLGLMDRFNNLTGGAFGKAVTDLGGKFIAKIGNESVRSFAENGLKLLAEKGFQGGFNAILSGGASTAATTAGTAAAGAGTAAGAGVLAGISATGWGAIIAAGILVLKGLKKLGDKIRDGINGLVANGRGEDEEINKITRKPWFIPVVILIFLLTGCTLQNNQISTMVSPVDEEEVEYAGEHDTSVLKTFKIPTCRPNGKYPGGNDRTILRDIALSIAGKVVYSQISIWRVKGASPLWNTRVPESYDWARSGGKYLYDEDGNHIIDEARAAKRRMYPFYGLDCGSFAAWVWYQCVGDDWHYPNMADWNAAGEKTETGLDRVYSESVDDLKIGDVFHRTREESLDWCKDKETGEEAGCVHFALYIGNGQVEEEVGNGGDPAITTVYQVIPDYVKLERDHGYAKYPHTYRITDVFLD